MTTMESHRRQLRRLHARLRVITHSMHATPTFAERRAKLREQNGILDRIEAMFDEVAEGHPFRAPRGRPRKARAPVQLIFPSEHAQPEPRNTVDAREPTDPADQRARTRGDV